MSPTEDQSGGREAMVEALRVRRNAKRGIAVGVLITAFVFYAFVVVPATTVRSPVYYVALAFVLAMTTSGLVTVLLVAIRAYRLTGDLDRSRTR